MLRRLTTFAALIACLVYATLLPWHGAMRVAGVSSAAAALDDALQTAICHGGSRPGGAGTVGPASLPSDDAPQVPGPDCEICKSLAGMGLALPAPAMTGTPARTIATTTWHWTERDARDVASIQPRNRGPPAVA